MGKSSRRGRPKLHEEPATSAIHVRVTPAQRLELRRVAEENSASVSGIIRESVNEFVADYRERRRPFRRSPKL
jgi:hypothetical protein